MAGGALIPDLVGPQDRLSSHQRRLVAICGLGGMLEFLDGYIIAFVLAFITGPWHLQYGQTAIVLLSSGVGALFGSLVWGQIADWMGRRAAFAATICTCGLGSFALALTPEGNWIYLAVMRLVVGFGTGGFFIPMMLVQEFLPRASRGRACGIVSAAVASGLVFGALSGSFLAPVFGWRGMFVVGGIPLFFGLAVLFLIPESPQWALSKGKRDLAQRALEWAVPRGTEVTLPNAAVAPESQRLQEVLRYPGSLAMGVLGNLGCVTGYYGLVMWSPTLIAQVHGISGATAAKWMIGISLSGLVSRSVTGALSDRFGRRRCGIVAAFLTGVALILTALVGHGDLFDKQSFGLLLALTFVFADSTMVILAIYTPEVWPAHVRGRGSGLAYAAGGIGKIVGPLGFAMVLGTSNIIRPMATVDAIINAFGFLAVAYVLAGVTFLVAKPEVGLAADVRRPIPA